MQPSIMLLCLAVMNCKENEKWKTKRIEKQESIETMGSENQRRVMQAFLEGNEERGGLYVCDFCVVVIELWPRMCRSLS